MPTNASAKKRVRRNEARATINSDRRNEMRTFVKKVELALAAGDAAAAAEALKTVQPKLARGVAKGVIEKNTAARKMSRLNARVKALKA
ncbi:MAG: 30S ribosomal protein S20 [Micavibrio sp.]